MSGWSSVMTWTLVPVATGSPIGRLFFWAGGLILVIILAGFAVGRIRKWMRPDVRSASPDAWSLQDLRDLRRDGRISEREFETLRAAIIAECQAKADRVEDAGESRDPPAG